MADKNLNFDVIVVGAGPAGLTAAVWCTDLGLSSVILEKESEKGGQLLHIYNNINNYPGCSAANGQDLRDRFLDSICKSRATFVHDADMVDIDVQNLSVQLMDRMSYTGRALLFATGVRRRKLMVPGESKFAYRGILTSGARDRMEVSDKIVAIVGGGDAALENSLILAENAKKVYVIHRRGEFRARSEFVDKAESNPKVELILNAEVRAIHGDDAVSSVAILDKASGEAGLLDIDKLLIRIGVEPNSGILEGKAALDSAGYVIVDRLGRTSLASIYAAGDVANPLSMSVATSVGTAATAVKAISDSFQRK